MVLPSEYLMPMAAMLLHPVEMMIGLLIAPPTVALTVAKMIMMIVAALPDGTITTEGMTEIEIEGMTAVPTEDDQDQEVLPLDLLLVETLVGTETTGTDLLHQDPAGMIDTKRVPYAV